MRGGGGAPGGSGGGRLVLAVVRRLRTHDTLMSTFGVGGGDRRFGGDIA